MIVNQHFYNLNEMRNYPLDDAATAIATSGARLPSDVLADLTLRFPQALGRVAFLSSLSVTPTLVTLTLQAVDDVTDPLTFRPLAALSMAREDIEPGRQYVLLPQSDGVAGFVVFGAGTDEPYTGRFMPAAGLIAPRCGRPYRPLPVTSLGKLNTAQPLTGIVRLRGEEPIQVVGEDREINGILRRVAVVRMLTSVDAASPESLYHDYAGPCGNRPESKTCGPFDPIESINGVAPDCDGKITLALKGCAILARYQNDSAAVIDCGLSLAEACGRKPLPDVNGRLPVDRIAQCVEYEDVSLSLPEETGGGGSSGGGSAPAEDSLSVSYELLQGHDLPFFMSFDHDPAVSPYENEWQTANGNFSLVEDDVTDDAGEQASTEMVSMSAVQVLGCKATDGSVSTRNVAVWHGISDHTQSLRFSTRLKMLSRISGAKSNGGLIINYSPHPTIAGRYTYYVVEIDRDALEFRISRFNGTTLSRTSAFVSLPAMSSSVWYGIAASVVRTGTNSVQLTGHLTGPNGLAATIGPLAVSNFTPDDGFAGLHADRAETRFAFLRVEAASA